MFSGDKTYRRVSMTLGCRWQEKNFSVAVNQVKPSGLCDICQANLYSVRYAHNGRQLCQACFAKQPSIRQKLDTGGLGFNTTRDKLYEFTDDRNFRHPVEIRGKGHWKRLLKQHGLTDDFQQKPKRPENLKSPSEDFKPTDRKFIRDQILKELQEKGLRDKLIRRR